jgi:hypothetical protein
MAQRSGLFDSTEIVETIEGYPKGNRAETADFFAKYFSNFISNGVFAKPTTNFQVTASGGMTVNIKPGSCFINGYMAWDEESESHEIPTDTAQHDYYFIQRLYLPDGAITKMWLTDPDVTAIPVRTVTTHDLIIAMVRVPANAREITDSMITDCRFDTDKCGIVHGVIDQLDTSDIALQLNTAVQEYITAAENSLVTWRGSFDQWFEAVKNQLSGDAATALEANKMARAYTVEDSAEDVVNRTAILAGYYLAEGQTVYVRFVNAVPAGATLNVNNTGNVPIYNGDEPISKVDIPADTVAAMLYTGDKYILLNPAVSASGVTYITASGSSAVIANTESGAPAVINTGDRFSVLCGDEASANATLNINGTGAHPILNNYTGAPIVSGDIPAGYTADIVFDGTSYILLNALVVSGTPTGSAFFTQNGTFTVPNFVNAIKVSACAAGVGRYAGEYLIDKIYNVTPGQIIELTIGAGNTIIGDFATLIAGTVAGATPTTKLGYAAGYNGGSGRYNTNNGYGGAFGFGGGGGGSGAANKQAAAGGGGAGIGGNGGTPASSSGGSGGGTTGGIGGTAFDATVIENGGDAASGKLIFFGATVGQSKGGDGSIYGAGGGGNNIYGSAIGGGGGAAGGYGAGCGGNGNGTYTADPSHGMVMIEWGGTVA